MLILSIDNLEIVVEYHDPYTPGAVNTDSYDIEYRFAADEFCPRSIHSVTVKEDDRVIRSCILIAGGGATGIHEHSAILHHNLCIIAVGPYMCALGLPTLQLMWRAEVDAATCFGVHYSKEYNCFISHGELEIARVEVDGEIKWRSGGADIHTNGFELYKDHVEVVDWNNWRYFIDLDTGQSRII